jgi:hypothetical protein
MSVTHRHYVTAYADVLDDIGEKFGPIALAVYVRLCRHADKNDYSFPSYQHIADKIGASRKSVIRGMATLVKAGYVKPHKRSSGKGQQTSNGYALPHYPGVVGVSLTHEVTTHKPVTDQAARALVAQMATFQNMDQAHLLPSFVSQQLAVAKELLANHDRNTILDSLQRLTQIRPVDLTAVRDDLNAITDMRWAG